MMSTSCSQPGSSPILTAFDCELDLSVYGGRHEFPLFSVQERRVD